MIGALAAFLQDQIPVKTHMVSLLSENEKLRFLPCFLSKASIKAPGRG